MEGWGSVGRVRSEGWHVPMHVVPIEGLWELAAVLEGPGCPPAAWETRLVPMVWCAQLLCGMGADPVMMQGRRAYMARVLRQTDCGSGYGN